MKILKKNAKLAEHEENVRTKEEILNQERVEYLEALRGDPKFRQYVIEEIFESEITSLMNIDSIPMDGSPTSVYRVLLAARKAKSILEKIKRKLV